MPKWAHKVYNNQERPPWHPVAGGANSVLGADIEPALGKIERAEQQRQLWADRHLIQSLRVPEDPNSGWRLEPARRKHMLDQAYGRGLL